MAEAPDANAPEVFLSYSHDDRAKVALLASFLTSVGFKVWLDTEDLVAGDRLIERISSPPLSR